MRLAISLGGAVLLVLGLSYARARVEAGRELARGDAAERRGDLTGARLHWRRAARWHAPGGASADALERLAQLARRRADAGDREGALRAWQALHGALASGDGLFVAGHAAARAEARVALADLGMPVASGPGHRPRPLGAAAAFAGLALFAGALWHLAREGLDLRGGWRHGPLRGGVTAAALGLALLVAGLLTA